MSKYSDFWFDRQTEVNDFLATIGTKEDDIVINKPKKDHMGLAGHKRAIGNFVRIVSGENIPVKFMTRGDSFTDGKSVTISSNINEKNFDHVVGLALHEGSHIAYSDFEVFKEVRNLTKIRNWDLTPARMEFLRGMINYIEDRRIDSIVFKSSPGYKGYYHTLYSKYFNNKKIGKGLKSTMYRDVDFESYMFRIVNFTNEGTDLNALPRLLDIYRLVDMKNISRLKSTDDVIEVAKSICDVVFKLVDENKGDGKPENGEGEEDSEGEEENGSSSNNKGGGTEVDSGDKEMTPEDGEPTEGEEISDSMKKSIENIYKKTKELLEGKTPKSKMTKNDKKIVDALGNSNSELVEVGGTEGLSKTKVVVVPDLTQALIDSKAFHFLHHYSYSYRSSGKEEAIADGLRLGAILGKKLKVRGEEKDLIYTRQTSGKINKRLIAELGFDNGNVFSQVFTERYNKANLHISIDASGSMSGNKLSKSITSAVAMVKAAEMAGNIHVVVSFRWTQDDKPVVIICYDSRKDKITKIKKLWKYINAGGTTPESLCYEALMKKWLGGVNGDDNYFINYSDGAPWFSNNEIYYHGACAEKHTKKMVKMMKNNGIKISSYFIKEGDYSYGDDKNVFSRMYGRDASFINPTNMMEVAKSMNSKFLEK
ncbi:MAG: VWA domain-containing protein [Candidatus Marinimicrobia bacterium]|nr:VWA domain-containing protein [Candidatus Neomarinimicrobiota bacterium]